MPRRSPIPRRSAGFTLLEALITLVVLLLAVHLAGQSLLAVVRVSRDAALDRDAALRLRNLAAGLWLGKTVEELAAQTSGGEWILKPETGRPFEPNSPWTHWLLVRGPGERLVIELSLVRRLAPAGGTP